MLSSCDRGDITANMHWKQKGVNELCVVGLGGSNGAPALLRPRRPGKKSVTDHETPGSSARTGGQKSVKKRLFTPSLLSNPRSNLPDINDNKSVITVNGTAKALHGNISVISCKSGEPNRLSPDILSSKHDNEKMTIPRCDTEKDNVSLPPTHQQDVMSVSSKLFSERSAPTMATSNARVRSMSCDLTRNAFTVTPIALTKRGDTSPRSSPVKSISSVSDDDNHEHGDGDHINMPPIGRTGSINDSRRSERNPKRFCSKPLPMSRQRLVKSFQDTLKDLEVQDQSPYMPRELQSGSVKAFQRLIILNQMPKQHRQDLQESEHHVTFAPQKPQTAPPFGVTAETGGVWTAEDTGAATSSNRERKMVMQLNQLSRKYQQEKTVKFALDSPSAQAESHDNDPHKERVIPKEEIPREKLVNHWLSDCPVVDSSATSDRSSVHCIPRRKIVLNVPSPREDVQET